MTLHLYCVRRGGEPAPGAALAGVAGAPVRLLEGAGLGLWVSALAPADPAPPAPDAERLREHDRVVRAALRSATPLPIRFGAALPGEQAALRLLEERREEWLAALGRVAGRVEMGLAVGWHDDAERAAILAAEPAPTPSAAAPASGREYLERRRHERRVDTLLQERARECLARVEASLREAARPTELPEELPAARVLLPRPGIAATLAQLVPRGAVAAYRAQVERARAALPDLELQLSGPWAPYNFV